MKNYFEKKFTAEIQRRIFLEAAGDVETQEVPEDVEAQEVDPQAAAAEEVIGAFDDSDKNLKIQRETEAQIEQALKFNQDVKITLNNWVELLGGFEKILASNESYSFLHVLSKAQNESKFAEIYKKCQRKIEIQAKGISDLRLALEMENVKD